jgi:hypothetical protein
MSSMLKDYAVRLSLYSDAAGTMLRDTSDYVALKFRFRGEAISLRSPTDPLKGRAYGFRAGGRTAGGAREWLIDYDSNLQGLIEWIE